MCTGRCPAMGETEAHLSRPRSRCLGRLCLAWHQGVCRVGTTSRIRTRNSWSRLVTRRLVSTPTRVSTRSGRTTRILQTRRASDATRRRLTPRHQSRICLRLTRRSRTVQADGSRSRSIVIGLARWILLAEALRWRSRASWPAAHMISPQWLLPGRAPRRTRGRPHLRVDRTVRIVFPTRRTVTHPRSCLAARLWLHPIAPVGSTTTSLEHRLQPMVRKDWASSTKAMA